LFPKVGDFARRLTRKGTWDGLMKGKRKGKGKGNGNEEEWEEAQGD